jgi:mannan polymerase II complex MNN10 subunit
LNLQGAVSDSDLSPRSGQTLATIPGTPTVPMSLSRSPSPRPGGGWASPGLAINGSGRSSPVKTYAGTNGGSNVTWESAKAKSAGVNGYPSFSTQNNGFFNRHYRRLSSSLPRFNLGSDKSYAEKEKLGRGRWMLQDGGRIAQVRKRVRSLVRRTNRKAKIRILVLLGLLLMIILFYTTRMSPHATS